MKFHRSRIKVNFVWGKEKKRLYKSKQLLSSRHGAVETNPTRNYEVAGTIPGLIQWVEDPVLP